MKKLNLAFFLGCLLAFGCVGCKKNDQSSASAKASQTIRLNIAHEPQSLDPRKARALCDINLIKMFMEGLSRVDKNGKASLALAKGVKILDEGLTYEFTLREAKWSNGDPITSFDFAYTWKKSLSPTFNSPNSYILYIIKNAKEVRLGKLPSSLLGIETPNEKTLIVKLNHPAPFFLELLEHPIFFPVNAKVDRQNPSWPDNASSFVTNGPFILSDWKHHNLIEAARNENYWDRKAVKLNKLKMYMVSEETGFNMFDSHELDWDGSPFSVIPTDAMHTLKQVNKLKTVPTLATQLIRINTAKTPFHSQKMRRAFGLAVNRQDIIEHVIQGNQIAATGIVPKSMGLQDKAYFSDGSSDEAVELFEQALEEMNLTREALPEITFTYNAGDRNQSVAQALQQQWYAAFGVRVRLEPIEQKVFFSRVSKEDYMLSLGNWFADFNDPINFLEVFKTKTNGTNNTSWENPSYIELIDTSYECRDPYERLGLLRQCEQLLIDEMPIIPIFHYTLSYIQDEALQGVVLTQMGMIDFKWARLDKN